MRKSAAILLLILSMTYPLLPSAEQVIDDDVLANCSLSPNIGERPFYPGKEEISNHNNLRRKTGAALNARGHFIKLTGRVVDESCVPILGALVEIWQTNDAGYYSPEISKNSDDYDPNFTESGSDHTSNLGSFEFVTIYPGRREKSAPHINIKIIHPDFEEFNSVIYFSDEKKNFFDVFLYKKAKTEQEKYLAKKAVRPVNMNPLEDVYFITIGLKGNNKLRRY